MSDQVINIVNKGFGRAGLAPLTSSDYDSSLERNPLIIRNEFSRLYRELANLQQEEFKTYFDITTIADTNSYTLSVDITKIDTSSFYLLDTTGSEDIKLYYLTEKEVLWQYQGDLSEIETGEPYAFFFETTSTANIKKISFLLKPDDVYTIRGYYYQGASALTGASLTACNEKGDEYLEDAVYAHMMYITGIIPYQQAEQMKRESRQTYICQNFNVNKRVAYNTPYQHDSAGGGIIYTRNGTAFL